MIKVEKVTLYHITQKLKVPFTSSIGHVTDRDSILVEVIDCDGVSGWGEVVAFSTPWYTEETISTCFHLLKDILIPLVISETFEHPDELQEIFKRIKRNQMAKASLEGAIWDLYAKKKNVSLSAALGGVRNEIECGVVVGISSFSNMIEQITRYHEEGYKRFKIKISPDQDMKIVEEIRKRFPDLPLMADANSSYTLNDVERLKELDQFGLIMIEQPLAADDIVDHAKLQEKLSTPICLDESIITSEDARKAIELGSCQVINIKPGRVGGLTESKKIHDLCLKNEIPVWCGGMLETSISRAHNIALASLANFTIPGDISSSSRYWEKDIVDPEIRSVSGKISVPNEIGIGYKVKKDLLKSIASSVTVLK
ncbi:MULTISPECIES: o-succinylbenzoate synthase [Bacillaceae]|uniref:o-succinylbenzoate synthase n=1 Tax=Bacillaceae TaxID=186817 RepID=UPI000BFB209B|nr:MULTISPECIES: o-succinylbenzoate synthase [Bacillaceae]PGT91098.1 o-succinylbenzoate synthase [Bacillus sp. AFS040349]UGB29920.1 o-succinylbenzoate synthase [Metabacillus sp. B2-18]